MDKDPFPLKDQADGIDVTTSIKVEVLEKKRMGPPGPISIRYGSWYSMSRTCGPQEIISLVIPRLGITGPFPSDKIFMILMRFMNYSQFF
jgi:hypothetical protein